MEADRCVRMGVRLNAFVGHGVPDRMLIEAHLREGDEFEPTPLPSQVLAPLQRSKASAGSMDTLAGR
jgi:hypothetical protein